MQFAPVSELHKYIALLWTIFTLFHVYAEMQGQMHALQVHGLL